jgi:heptosyltransferase-1
MNILIIKTSSMGDIIHCLPVITDILTHFPTAKIDWLVEEGFTDIVNLHPKVRKVIPVAIRRWRKHLFSRATWHELSSFKHQLKEQHYDVILDAQSLLKSALLATLATGTRHGQSFPCAREPLAALFYHRTYMVTRQQHALEQNRAIAAKVFAYDYPTSAPDYGLRLAHDDAPIPLPENFVMAFHATSRDSKLWPNSHWINLGQQLNKQGIKIVLPWANASELTRAQAIAKLVAEAVVLPKSNLTTLAHITAKAQVAIGVDTGLMHLAVALNIPTIALFTDTYPALNGAYAGNHSMAINLGGRGMVPSVDEVLKSFARFTSPQALASK